MNKVFLVGNLVRDPQLSVTPSGNSVCKFTIGVNRNHGDVNGEKQSDFINIIAWRTVAENCGKYLTKGKKVAISGSLQLNSFDDRNGNKRTIAEVIAQNIEFLGGGKNEAVEPNKTPEKEIKQMGLPCVEPVDDDDLPF